VGIQAVGGTPAEVGLHMTDEMYDTMEIDKEVGAVVLGLDYGFNYYKLCMATLYIEHGGARFICCNPDLYDNIQGRKLPAAGALIEAVMTSLNKNGSSDQ